MPRGDQLGKATEDHLDPDHFRERKICGRTRLRDLEDARKVGPQPIRLSRPHFPRASHT